MPTLATGSSTDRRLTPGSGHRRAPGDRGFTLIELLVVVTVIGVIAAAAVLALTAGGRDRDIEQQARRLTALLELASEEAIMQGREFGFELVADGYRFVVYEPETDEWWLLDDDMHLGPRQLPEGLRPGLAMEGRELTLPTAFGETPRPQVMLLSSGEITPFQLTLQRQGQTRPGASLDADAFGRLSLALGEEVGG